MQAPIPDDWTSEVWQCYTVQWPDSTLWLGILHGLLSTPRQGRFWNARSGNIKNVQAVGDEIWWRNTPLLTCAASPDCPTVSPEPFIYLGAGDDCSDCEDDMANSCPTPPIKIEGGKLYYWTCCAWVEVGAIAAQAEEIEGNPGQQPGEEAPAYSACGKAQGATALIFKTASAAWEAYVQDMPWEWPTSLRADVPELSGGLTWWIAACQQAFQCDTIGLFTEETLIPDAMREEMACRLAARLADDGEGLDADDMSWLIHFCSDYFPWTANPLNAYAGTFWTDILSCIGVGDLSNAAKAGALATDAECPCPNEVLGYRDYFGDLGEDQDWVYEFDFRDATLHSAVTIGPACHHTPGVGIWATPGETTNNTNVWAQILWDLTANGSAITRIGIAWRTRGDENWNDGDVQVHQEGVSADLVTYAEVVGVCGENPAIAGSFSINKLAAAAITSGNDEFLIEMYAYHPGDDLPDEEASSNKIIAVRIAGSGPGPLSTPPV